MHFASKKHFEKQLLPHLQTCTYLCTKTLEPLNLGIVRKKKVIG